MEDGARWCEGPTLLLLYSLMPAQDFSEADASGCCILLVKSGKVLFRPVRWMNFLFFASIVLPNWEQGRVDMVVVWDGKQFWLMYHPVMERAVYCVFFVARKCAFMIARLRCVQIISKRAWISQKIPLVTSTWPLHQCTAKSGTYHQLGFGLKLSPQNDGFTWTFHRNGLRIGHWCFGGVDAKAKAFDWNRCYLYQQVQQDRLGQNWSNSHFLVLPIQFGLSFRQRSQVFQKPLMIGWVSLDVVKSCKKFQWRQKNQIWIAIGEKLAPFFAQIEGPEDFMVFFGTRMALSCPQIQGPGTPGMSADNGGRSWTSVPGWGEMGWHGWSTRQNWMVMMLEY